MVYTDGEIYTGQYFDDMRHGKGMCQWPDGHRYNGDFIQNEFHGKGEYRWADGKVYDGEWVNSNITLVKYAYMLNYFTLLYVS